MNAKTLVLCVLFLTASFVAKASDPMNFSKIPGGIIHSDSKSIIYYDFGTKENTILGPADDTIKAAAVSKNGEFLIIFKNSRFWLKELPNGEPVVIQVQNMKTKGNIDSHKGARVLPGEKEDFVWQGSVKNLCISDDGSKFAFESAYTNIGLVLVDEGNPSLLAKFAAAGLLNNVSAMHDDRILKLLPSFVNKIDSCNGIFLPSTNYNEQHPPFSDAYKPRFGNLIDRAAVPLYKIAKPMPNGRLIDSGTMIHGLVEGPSPNGIKRNACFPSFRTSRLETGSEKTIAFIYQTGNQWGPIGIETSNSQISAWYYDRPRHNMRWEIPIYLPSCEGLSWTPDGSICFLSQGNLYLINAEEIQKGIKNSGIKEAKNSDRKSVRITHTNNVFEKPKLITNEVKETCLSPVSKDAYIFLNKNREVCLWSQGETDKLPKPLSSNFCYCEKSPLNASSTITSGKGQTKDRDAPDFEKWGNQRIGYITVTMIPNERAFYVGEMGSQKPLRYCVIDGSDLGKIKDPRQYKYSSVPEGVNRKGNSILYSEKQVKVPAGSCILLNKGDKFSAVNMTSIEFKKYGGYSYTSIKNLMVEVANYGWRTWDFSANSFDKSTDTTKLQQIETKPTPIQPKTAKVENKTASVVHPKSDLIDKKLFIAQLAARRAASQMDKKEVKTPFFITKLKFQWENPETDSIQFVAECKKELQASVAILEKGDLNLNLISDPSQYSYKPFNKENEKIDKITLTIPNNGTVSFNVGDDYILIKYLRSNNGQIIFEKRRVQNMPNKTTLK